MAVFTQVNYLRTHEKRAILTVDPNGLFSTGRNRDISVKAPRKPTEDATNCGVSTTGADFRPMLRLAPGAVAMPIFAICNRLRTSTPLPMPCCQRLGSS